MSALADRVKESTTTTGTGSLTLAGAVTQFESFNTAFGTANPFYYVITDANGTDWEVGTGELSDATTLVRTTVHQSSNGDAKINLSAGTHTVFCSAPAVFLSDRASKTGKLSQFAATTSAELAGVISDETGSGALVFATSPALTTPSLGVATATSVNGTTIPSSKTLVVTTDKLSALAATTSSELAGVISDETGSGALVFATSPTLTTPNIGAATAMSVNGTTIPSSKTLVVTTDKLSALAATTSAELAGVISDETGTGSLVFATSPALTTPNLGTPSAGTLTNCTDLPVGGVSGLGTGVGTALAVNTGSAGAFVVNGGALGTPSSGTLTNATGLPVSSGVSGLGTGVATALAVNTGTAGAFVVNGGALGTPSSGTVTNLTGTASININGTVGATTANTGAFTTLSASGVATFSAGTVSAPAITTTGDTNTGEYFPAADTIAWTTGGTERMRVDSSGNVGIGTSSPQKALNVVVNSSSTTIGGSTAVVQIGNSNGGSLSLTAGIELFGSGAPSSGLGNRSGGIYGLYESFNASGNAGALVFATNPAGTTSVSERVRITSAGDMGLGGTPNNYSGQTCFTINHASGYSRVDFNIGGTKKSSIYGESSSNLMFETNGSERARITSAGNVGIGTSSPLDFGGANLQIQNSTIGSVVWSNGTYVGQLLASSAAEVSIGSRSNHPLRFGTNDTERMRLDTSGNVLIGTTSVVGASGAGRLHVLSVDGSQIHIRNSTATAGRRWEIGADANNAIIIYNQDGTGQYMTNGGTTWNANSDERLKTDLEPIADAANKLMTLRAVTGRFKTDEESKRRAFLIAQDVQKVLPEAVSVQDDEDKTLGLAYTDVIPLLTAAIQELKAQNDQLTQRIAALEAKP